MITLKDLTEQREQIQQDLVCVLDGYPADEINRVCEIVCDRFLILAEKLEPEQATRAFRPLWPPLWKD